MTTREQVRRSDIVDAAARLFAVRGYGGTTIDAVATEVGILKGSLYHHIAGKEDLLVAVIDEVHDAAMTRLTAATGMGGTVLERLAWFLTDHATYNCRHLDRITVYFREFEQLTGDRRRRVDTDRRRYDRFVRTLIDEGRATGEVADWVDARIAANAALGMVNWVHQWFDAATQDPDTVAADLARLAMAMVEAPR